MIDRVRRAVSTAFNTISVLCMIAAVKTHPETLEEQVKAGLDDEEMDEVLEGLNEFFEELDDFDEFDDFEERDG